MVEVSVIIPVYNAQDTIIRAIESINRQNFSNPYEIIVVNDGSIDDTVKVVENYINKSNSNNIYLYSKPNGGVSTARNYGINKSNGEMIALLDADDEWALGKIDVQMEILRNNKDVSLVGTTLNGIVHKRNLFKKFSHETVITLKDQLLKNYFQPSTVIFRKSIIEKTGLFPEDQKYAEEGIFFFRAVLNYKCVLINASYLNFGDGKRGYGEGGLSANLKEMQKGEIRNLHTIYNHSYISFPVYVIVFLYSYLKYLRRIIFSIIKKEI